MTNMTYITDDGHKRSIKIKICQDKHQELLYIRNHLVAKGRKGQEELRIIQNSYNIKKMVFVENQKT
jgi:hypothetical protein